MKKQNIRGLFALVTIVLIISCSDRNEVIYPIKYAYNTSTITDQGAYTVSNTVVERINGDIGYFAMDKKSFRDSLNTAIAYQFLFEHVMAFELISPTKLRITNYDSKVGIIVNEVSYTMNGNQIITDGNRIITLNPDFSDIKILGELYSFSGFIRDPPTHIRALDFNLCTTTDPLISVQNIVNDDIGIITYDTISLDYVNMIYTKQ